MSSGLLAMSDQNRFGSALTEAEKEKIDRAAWHEQVHFLKRQQWAVTTAGVALFGAFLALVRNQNMSAWEKHLAVLLIVVAVAAGCFFLQDLQDGLAVVRQALDPGDRKAATRGEPILVLHKAILVASAAFVLWIVLFKTTPILELLE
jgi:hypothetical protein